MSDDLEISGGATGIAATLADVRRHAALLSGASSDLVGIAGQVAAVGLTADLAQAALLCPDHVATVEQRIAAASASPHEGVLVIGTELAALGAAVRWCADAYEETDSAIAAGLDVATKVGGFVMGWAAPVALAPFVAALSAACIAEPELGLLLSRYAASGGAAADLDEFFATHPAVLDRLLREAPWLVQGVTTFGAGAGGVLGQGLLHYLTGGRWASPRYEDSVGGLAAVGRQTGALTDSGRFTVATSPTAVADPVPLNPAAPLGGLLRHQAWMDSWLPPNTETERPRARAGQVGIVTITADDGTTAYVVTVPGTETWEAQRGNNPIDLATNIELMSEHQAQMTTLVAEAIRTHVPAGAPILLVGHSQGGITAASVAADRSLGTPYQVRGVVTVGSPIARFPLDPGLSVLSVEHKQDAVPLLDGADNPDQPAWVTVRRDLTEPEGELHCSAPTLDSSHDLSTYQDTALAVDTSDAPALAAWREANAVFFTGTAQARQYAIESVS